MAPKEWTTIEQFSFLTGQKDAYLVAQKGGSSLFQPFWETLFEKWFETFPEAEAVFPSKVSNKSLTDVEKKTLQEAIIACRKVN